MCHLHVEILQVGYDYIDDDGDVVVVVVAAAPAEQLVVGAGADAQDIYNAQILYKICSSVF